MQINEAARMIFDHLENAPEGCACPWCLAAAQGRKKAQADHPIDHAPGAEPQRTGGQD
jgi:hypothetical protein